ncbi:hypothetical protein LX36DRAFT_27655 [Colletotrichum falcatum]|nr:hypothetical protein LX36DRAFT_27655 [Colletotrichum falcatum]
MACVCHRLIDDDGGRVGVHGSPEDDQGSTSVGAACGPRQRYSATGRFACRRPRGRFLGGTAERKPRQVPVQGSPSLTRPPGTLYASTISSAL